MCSKVSDRGMKGCDIVIFKKRRYKAIRYLINVGIVLLFIRGISWSGGVVFEETKVVIEAGHHAEKEFQFSVPGAKGKYWLYVYNGDEKGNEVKSGEVWLNGEKIVSPKDLHKKVSRVLKDVKLIENNVLRVKIRGDTGSFVEVSIYKAELNLAVNNRKMDLSGINDGPPYGIRLYWERDDRAERYIFYRSYSMDGPWEMLYSIGKGYWTGAAVDSTPYLTERDHCYKVEAVDKSGKVIRRYEPVCVPRYQTEE